MESDQDKLLSVLPVLFLLILAGSGIRFASSIQRRFRPPLSVSLFILGILISTTRFYTYNPSAFNTIGNGALILSNVGPEVFFLLLLPPLLYESSSKIDWHTFRRVAVQSLLLAFPGVLISMSLTAVFVYYAFPYNWSWYVSFMVGSILSATDPVSVVAALQEIGAPERVSVLVRYISNDRRLKENPC